MAKTTPKRNSSKGLKAKQKRLKEMIREAQKERKDQKRKVIKNPPRNWIKAKAVRVIKRDGKEIVEIKR